MQEHNTRGRSEGCGGGGLPVVGLGLAVLMGLSCIACSSSGLTEATDGTGQPEVWEVKANDIKVADGFADLLDLRGDVAGFDVWVAPEVCADRNAGPWCPCDTNTDCLSGWCVFHFGDKVCSKTCVEECPEGWSCEPAPGPDPVSVCKSLYPSLCLPCTSTEQCANVGGGKCAVYGPEVGAFCGAGCDEDTLCPAGYECKDTETTEAQTSSQCMLVEEECPCTVYAVAEEAQTGCSITNDFGTCEGWRVCSEEGLGECSVATPAEETCDGEDNDCDGSMDEGDLCDDADDCTKDDCAGEDGCTHEPLDGVACFDGDTCTYDDHCEAGQCVGSVLDCDDSNQCTDDWCDAEAACLHEENSEPCEDDGDPCTEDGCQESECTHPPGNDGATCEEDGSPCTVDLCDAGECTHPAGNDGELCVDDDPCTIDEHCEGGLCVAGGVNPSCLSPCGDGLCSPSPADEDCPVDCGSCGDGVCGLNEAGLGGGTCPGDCLPPCGNGLCEGGENPDWCLVDCSGCGDGVCGLGESPEQCLGDCPVPCGDGECGFGEGPLVCPVDCTPPCGDGICQTGENPYTCSSDCATCGDGICGGGESEENCAQDCDTPCGNGICDGNEMPEECPVDCGPCGDGTCGFSETGQSCPADCWEGCGDGKCQAYLDETADNCSTDCVSDKDNDGVEDKKDNCAALYNPEQEDFDLDGVGDLCDLDDDNDGDFDATDCEPLDAAVSHLAAETCNGIDDDCSGDADEEVECPEGESCQAGQCQVICGDGLCAAGFENCATCEADCGCSVCGEVCVGGLCLFTACNDKECGDDGCGGSCGECNAHYECADGACWYVPWCGDLNCDAAEDCAGCPGDCGDCCGNGLCDNGETCCTCDQDCDSCCGNGLCDCGEDQCTCPADCGDPCEGTECGNDGCGGSCGTCGACEECKNGECITTVCWTDPGSGLTWQNPPASKMIWSAANQYCTDLGLAGGGWHLPTIGELRSLIRGCPATVDGGSCNVKEGDCLGYYCKDDSCSLGCENGAGPVNGNYWPDEMHGSGSSYWSSSLEVDIGNGLAWYIHFGTGYINHNDPGNTYIIRCVREAP